MELHECLLCRDRESFTLSLQKDEGDFFLKMLRMDIHLNESELGKDSSPSFLSSPYFQFCINCHTLVLNMKSMYSTFLKLKTTLKNMRVKIRKQLLSSCTSNISSKKASDGLTSLSQLRANLIQCFILNGEPRSDDLNSDMNSEIFLEALEELNNDVKSNSEPLVFDIEGYQDHEPSFDFFGADVDEESCNSEDPLHIDVSTYHIHSSDKKPNLKECSIALGDRIIPFECLNLVCGAKFGDARSLRRHMTSHRRKASQKVVPTQAKEYPQLPDKASLREAMDSTRRLQYPFQCQIIGCPSSRIYPSRVRLKRHIQGVHFKSKKLLELQMSMLSDEQRNAVESISTLRYPSSCPIAGCQSSKLFPTLASLHHHIIRSHAKEDVVSPKPETEEERKAVEALDKLRFPSKCPMESCKYKSKFEDKRKLERHLHSHFKARVIYSNIESEELRSELMATHKVEFPTQCIRTGCTDRLFKTRDMLKRHIRDVHFKEYFRPSPHQGPCALAVASVKKLPLPAKCPLEGCKSKTVFKVRDILYRHIREVHFGQPHGGYYPRRLDPELNQAFNEVESMTFPTTCPRSGCDSPDIVYTNRRALYIHIKFKHVSSRSKPRNVGADVNECSNSTKDMGETFASSTENVDLTMENGGLKSCEDCGRKFKILSCLRRHRLMAHLKEKPASICDSCGKSFASSHSLNQHRNLYHSEAGPPKFSCTFCPRTFITSSSRDRHVRRHTGEWRHRCRCCPRGFMFHPELEDHERGFHAEELGLEPIKCEICGKVFRKSVSLVMHKKSHAGNEDFSCSECSYKTVRKKDMAEHVATVHRDDKPFVCDTCGKEFKLERRLRQHLLVHIDKHPYKCDSCNTKFSSALRLQVHQERKHGAEPSATRH